MQKTRKFSFILEDCNLNSADAIIGEITNLNTTVYIAKSKEIYILKL